MKKIAFRVLMLVFICTANCLPAERPDATSIAASFLPPNSAIVKLERWDPQTGNSIGSRPAVLQGHILAANSSDIVFAYGVPEGNTYRNTLFVALLHKAKTGYVKVFEETYYARTLASQDFQSVGLQMLRPPGSSTDIIAVATQIGASLGATVEVFRWDDTWGLTNAMPENRGVHHLQYTTDGHRLSVALAFSKYPGEKNAPPPRTFTWTGKGFRRAP